MLTVAVVGLFAMMGELSSRVAAAQDEPQETAPPRPIGDARLGATAEQWPAEIAHLSHVDKAVIAVLSTICASCARIASGQTGPLPAVDGLLISCPRPSRGTEFVDENPMLRGYPVAFDVEGAWLTSNFEVDVSPSVLVFEQGRLVSAHTFTTAPSLHLLGSELHDSPHDHESHNDTKEVIRAGQTAKV